MKLLHISNIGQNKSSGISVVVPQHIRHQSRIVNVGFINVNNYKFNDIKHQFEYKHPFRLRSLPSGFDKPDLVIFHGCFFFEYIYIYVELKKNNIPYVIIPHGSFTKQSLSKKWLKKWIFRICFLNQFVKDAAGIQYLSKGEYDSTVFRHQVSFVGPNGIDEHNEVPTSPNKNIIITYIGRFDIFHKGIDLLCEAVYNCKHILVQNGVHINLYGPDQNGSHQKINSLIKKWDISMIVSVNQGVYGDEKKRILLESSYFIQTSRYEGLPMSILEALSFGLPCIITSGTNFTEIVDKYNAGWTCGTSPMDISKALCDAISEYNLFQVKSNNAKMLIHENYSWEIVTRENVKKYQQIVGCGAV